MPERESASKNKKEKAEQKYHVRQQESQQSFDSFHAWDKRLFSLTKTFEE